MGKLKLFIIGLVLLVMLNIVSASPIAVFYANYSMIDYSGNGKNLIPSGNLYNATDRNGIENEAIRFDGSNDYYSSSDGSFDMDNEGCLGAWINLTSLASSCDIINKDVSDGYRLLIQTSGDILVSRGAGDDHTIDLNLTINNWYHIAWQQKSSASKFWLNGVLMRTEGTWSALTGSSALRIGEYAGNGAGDCTVLMDDLFFFNDTANYCTNDNISNIYTNGLEQFLVVGSGTAITFVDNTPADEYITNSFTGDVINISSENNDINLYWDGTQIGDVDAITPYTVSINASMATYGNHTYYATNHIENSTTRNYIFDNLIAMEFKLNSNNTFDSSNNTVTGTDKEIVINFNVTDQFNVEEVSVKIYNSSNGIVYQNITTGYSSYNVEFYKSVNSTLYNNGLYKVELGYKDVATNSYEQNYSFQLNRVDIDNCSTNTYQFLNWSFYRAPKITTLGDDKISLTCTSTGQSDSITQYKYNYYGGALCSRFVNSFSCNGSILYTGLYTDGYIYSQDINYLNMSTNNITYYNLTIPKLFLNFSTATDIQVIDADTVYYFEDTSLLIAQSNLSIGKISVIFNGGTQFFEYYNDENTYINDYIKIIPTNTQNDYVNVRTQDQIFSVLSDAIVNIYEVDNVNNETTLINKLYGNNEKKIYLEGNTTYLAKAYYSGYVQDNLFIPFEPDELEGNDLIITMKEDTSNNSVFIYSNYGNILLNGSEYRIGTRVEGRDTIDTITITYVWDSDSTTTESDIATSRELYTSYRWFRSYHDNLSVEVNADGITKSYFYEHYDQSKQYDESYYQYEEMRQSKWGFTIFFIVSIVVCLAVQKRFSNYGIETFAVVTTLFSFLNLWMLVICIPTIIGLIGKNIAKEDI